RDALGLGQRGCMSARAVVVTNVEATMFQGLTERLAVAGAHFWRAALPSETRAALDVERCRYERLGWRVITPRDERGPLVAALHVERAASMPSVASFVATRPHVIPVVGVREDSDAFV